MVAFAWCSLPASVTTLKGSMSDGPAATSQRRIRQLYWMGALPNHGEQPVILSSLLKKISEVQNSLREIY